jgi:hypothetical protein
MAAPYVLGLDRLDRLAEATKLLVSRLFNDRDENVRN